jgi:hypothetical protein
MMVMPMFTSAGPMYDCYYNTRVAAYDEPPFLPCTSANQEEQTLLKGGITTANIIPFSGGMFFNDQKHDYQTHTESTSDTDFLYTGHTDEATRFIPERTARYRSTPRHATSTLYKLTTSSTGETHGVPDFSTTMQFLRANERHWDQQGERIFCGVDPFTMMYEYDSARTYFFKKKQEEEEEEEEIE